MNKRVSILSLGCPRNLVDSEIILGLAKQKRFTIVDDIQKSDIAIVNTCSFIEEAKQESIDAILDICELKKQGRIKKLIVAGCLAQQYGKALVKELPEVDAFVGRIELTPFLSRLSLTPPHFSYLKISEGCDNNCSYCVIPKIKGKFNSRNPQEVVSEAKELDKKGVKELNIIGQDITSYGKDLKGAITLAKLLKSLLSETKEIKWFRLLYLHPAHIDDELIDLISAESRICSYIDLPIQHIADRILKKMNRRIKRSEIISLINKIRKKVAGVVIRTSLIVGFPSETDEEFQQLLDFVKEVRFERLGAFIYSQEAGTPAYDFKRQIPEKIKRERFDLLMSAQQKIAYEFNQTLLNKEFEVLIDEKCEDDEFFLARTYMDAPEVDGQVFIKNSILDIGKFKRVRITDSYEYDLTGEII